MQLTLLLTTLLLLFTSSHCALNEEADRDIKSHIKIAVKQGLTTIDNQLRDKYWQFLRQSELVHYNTQILPQVLNYKLIYLHQNRIFRANCDIDKIRWKVYVNSLVRLPSNLVDRIYDENYQELFLLDKDVVIVDAPGEKRKQEALKKQKKQLKKKEEKGKGQAETKNSKTEEEKEIISIPIPKQQIYQKKSSKPNLSTQP